MQELQGTIQGVSLRVGIVAGRFNSFIVDHLIKGARDTLTRHGVKEENLTLVRVPGSFELPVTCRAMAKSGKFDALIALGVVIRGATTHYDLVCAEAAKGIAAVSFEYLLPIGFGLVTTETIEQAIERAGTKAGNKGIDAAHAALEMAGVLGHFGNQST